MRLYSKLHELANEWRDAWSLPDSDEPAIELPVLTGLLVIGSLTAVVTLDPNALDEDPLADMEPGQIHQVIVIDWSAQAMFVWNAIAFGIVAMHIRKVRLDYEDRADAAASAGVGLKNPQVVRR